HIFHAVDAEVSQLRDVHEPFLAGQHFHERSKLLHAAHNAAIQRAHFDLCRKLLDLIKRALHRGTARRIDGQLAGVILIDVKLCAGNILDTADSLTTGTDEEADLVRINLDSLDAGSVSAQLRTRRIERALHDAQNLVARLRVTADSLNRNLKRQP